MYAGQAFADACLQVGAGPSSVRSGAQAQKRYCVSSLPTRPPERHARLSNLGRLYTYAKGGTDAKEDFTTEALAICIRHDPTPFIEVLRAEGLVQGGIEPTAVVPYTQLSVPGVGRVDLVVRMNTANLEECWFEVKIDAPETGDQLARYMAHLSRLPSEGRPALIALARQPIRVDGPPLLTWRAVHGAARGSTTPHWQDFADWLEELRMVDSHDGPISPDELEALPLAVTLYEALSRLGARLLTPSSAVPAIRLAGRGKRARSGRE